MKEGDENKIPAVARLYPDYTPEERAEAEDAIKRYVNLVRRIYSRARAEKPRKGEKNRKN